MADPAPPIVDKREDDIERPSEERRKRLLRSVSISEKDGGALPPEELRKTLGELGVEPTPHASNVDKQGAEGEGEADGLPPPPPASVALHVAEKTAEEPVLEHVAARRVTRTMSTSRRPPSIRRDTIGSMRDSVSAALAGGPIVSDNATQGQGETSAATSTPPPPPPAAAAAAGGGGGGGGEGADVGQGSTRRTLPEAAPAPAPGDNTPPPAMSTVPATPDGNTVNGPAPTEPTTTTTTTGEGEGQDGSQATTNGHTDTSSANGGTAGTNEGNTSTANGNGQAGPSAISPATAATINANRHHHPSVAAEATAREQAEKEVTASFVTLRIDTLKAGQYFMKHGRKGSPHLRFVKLTADGRTLAYAAAKKGQKPDVSKCKKSMKVDDISKVVEGRQTDVFKRDKKAKEPAVSLSFSVLARDGRTLDLVAENRDHYVQWVDGLRALLEEPFQCDETFASIKAQVDSRMLNKMINENPAEKIGSQVPFARVDVVQQGSPAEQAGLLAGDLVVKLGSVTHQSTQPLSGAGAVVSSSEGQTLDVVVVRDGTPLMLTLTPQRWSGQGLLGCALLPWMSRRGSTIGGPEEYASRGSTGSQARQGSVLAR
eukprot:TRINITY_DN1710_c1_g1_i2.p1 TRINITY_DN1710_c1_g1~~TRINITY_DN1710_c1_g1_i2.p1  ORF type:complete len:601 (-),score=100.80 TRINITY_DN1710_c1_g1_i2:1309-3111(-)